MSAAPSDCPDTSAGGRSPFASSRRFLVSHAPSNGVCPMGRGATEEARTKPTYELDEQDDSRWPDEPRVCSGRPASALYLEAARRDGGRLVLADVSYDDGHHLLPSPLFDGRPRRVGDGHQAGGAGAVSGVMPITEVARCRADA